MCAMTGLNILSLACFEDGVIIWHFFIRMLGYYGSNAVGRIVKIFPLLGEGLRERVYLEDRKVRSSEGRLFTVKGLFSNCRCLSSCSDITSSCKTQYGGWSGTLPLSSKGRGKCTSLLTLHPSLKKRAAFTLAEGATHVVHFDDIRRAAFTLAEVLITLGIIGVVAAMTMPAIISSYQKKQTVSQLKKAYSLLSNGMGVLMRLGHGSAGAASYIKFYVDVNGESGKTIIGKDVFAFSMRPDWGDKYIFTAGVNGANASGVQNSSYLKDRDYLMSDVRGGCSKTAPSGTGYSQGDFCSLLIQIDGWKISDDYPW